MWKRSSLIMGNRSKKSLSAVTTAPTTVEQSSQEAEICWVWYLCKGATTSLTPTACVATDSSQNGHSDIHSSWEHSQVKCGIYPRWCQTPMKQADVVAQSDTWWKVVIATEATSTNIGIPRGQAHQLSEGDSPRAPNPLISDNNGSWTKSPPEPTHILLFTKYKGGISKAGPKRTFVKHSSRNMQIV